MINFSDNGESERMTHNVKKLVGVERFELPTSCSQSRRATRLRYTPKRSFIGRRDNTHTQAEGQYQYENFVTLLA